MNFAASRLRVKRILCQAAKGAKKRSELPRPKGRGFPRHRQYLHHGYVILSDLVRKDGILVADHHTNTDMHT
jgi:hypothetical protein